jgi:tryptophan 2,3-dioxygenase
MKYPAVHYHDYLKLDSLLSSQARRSEEFKQPAHDEWLFITVHQAYELWFKQIILEFDSIHDLLQKKPVAEADLGLMNRRLSRVVQILKFILGQIDILETMTPLDFLEFRDFLYPASGFQSFQFRCIETWLGLRRDDRLQLLNTPFENHLKPDQKEKILKLLAGPSLFDMIEAWLERTPFVEDKDFNFWKVYETSVTRMLGDDRKVIESNPRLSEEDKKKSLQMMEVLGQGFQALIDPNKYNELKAQGQFRLSLKALRAALMIQLYRDEPLLQAPHQLITHLLDIDEVLTQWRSRHALMAHRMLGQRIGTGGSSGSQYLKQATDKHKIFTDFFNLSSFLIPRSQIPPLPEPVKRKLNFSFSI